MITSLISDIKDCQVCSQHLPLGPRPVVTAHPMARIAIIGQAPGTKVHASGIPWDDASGKQLRKWLVPMGFCYPGKGKSGDLPPRPECAPLWHQPLFDQMPNIKLTILIGQYAQKYYLEKENKRTLTKTVAAYQDYLPNYLVLPHPSPRNRFWLTKNPWFTADVVPLLQKIVKDILIP